MNTIPESEKVPVLEKIAVGAGGFTSFFGKVGVKSNALPFYQMLLGVNPSLLGIVLALPMLWDAITDPIMGRISDNYQSRFGRRRPFIFVGAILMGITYGLIWMVPQGWGEVSMAIWLGVSSILFYTCYTIFSVPYQCLTFEMTPNYDERTSVMGYVSIWGELGELLYQWIVPLASLSFFASKIIGVQTVCWVIALVGMLLFGIIPAIFGKERYYDLHVREMKKTSIKKSFMEAMQNKAFRILIFLTLLQIISGLLASSMDYYLLVYYMFHGDIAAGSFWKGVLSSGYAVMGFVGIPVILYWSQKTSKVNVLKGVYVLLIIKSILSWFIFRPGNEYYIIIDPVFGALFWTAVTTVKQSMMADICDEDELNFGQRREGLFSAVFGWITKSAIALSFVLSGFALSLSGFDEKLGGEQAEDTFLAMRLTLMFGAMIPTLLAFYIISKFPITREKALETRAKLEAIRGTI